MKQICGIMPPMITPFKENGNVDYEAFIYNLKKWTKTGLSGLCVLGSNSETPYLRKDEKLELIRLTVQNAEDKLVIAGTGMETPEETVELTNEAADLGADYALVITPSFFDGAMTSDALEDYYTIVANGAKIPVLLYNVPKFTHVNIEPVLAAKLAAHPNIAGIKDSSGNIPQFASYIRLTKENDFAVLIGTAGALYPALALGAAGGILALANCNPDECVEIYHLFQEGKLKESCELYQRMFPVNAAVTGAYGISGLKAAATMMGYKGGFVRKPLQEQTEKNWMALNNILAAAQVI